MEYSLQDLESKKLDELKIIARNLQLPTSGRKQELINRILNNQQTYLKLLPKDILNIVDEYQIYNNRNNQFLLLLLTLLSLAKSNKSILKRDLPEELKKYILAIDSLRHNGNYVTLQVEVSGNPKE